MVGGYSLSTQFQAFSCVLAHKMRPVGRNSDRGLGTLLVIGGESDVAAGRPLARASHSAGHSVDTAVRISALVC